MESQHVTSTSRKEGVIDSVPRKSANVASLHAMQNGSHTTRTLETPLPSGTPSLTGGKLGRKKVEKRNRGQIIPRGDRKWLVRVCIGSVVGENGKRKYNYSSKTVTGTYKQAEQAMTGMLSEVDKDEFVPPSKQTLKEFMLHWFEHTAKMRVSETTLISYKSATKRPLELIGHTKLDKLTPQIIQRMYSDLHAAGISPRTIEMGNTVLKMALEQAVIWKQLSRNPTVGAERPKKVRVEAMPFTSEQADLFLEAAQKHEQWALWLTFYATGMRPQEVFPLKWTDLEERKVRVQRDGSFVTATTHVLVVQRAMKHLGKGEYVVREIMKTRKSRRTISIPQTLVDALTAHKRQQASAMLASGESFERNGYIFPNSVGRPLDLSKVRKQFHAICKTAKVPTLKLYALRHTHASELLAANVHLKTVSERLGHSSIMMTGDIYSHVMPEVEHETALTVDSMLNRRKAAG
jgi:integrase